MQTVSFGKNSKGEETSLYIFENSNHGVMKVSDHGATLVSLLVPDREGTMRDVVLGYDTAAEYENHTCYFGATVGRNGNRISRETRKNHALYRFGEFETVFTRILLERI